MNLIGKQQWSKHEASSRGHDGPAPRRTSARFLQEQADIRRRPADLRAQGDQFRENPHAYGIGRLKVAQLQHGRSLERPVLPDQFSDVLAPEVAVDAEDRPAVVRCLGDPYRHTRPRQQLEPACLIWANAAIANGLG